jgi:hypothetical protein
MSSSQGSSDPRSPPSTLVRAAQARLLEQLDVLPGEGAGGIEGPGEERYQFGELLAMGGLGLVRRAHDRRLGRDIAVKELRRSDPAAERRFLFEATITARLQHPGIVPIHDIGRFPDGEPYYCMKLVEGRSLEEIIHDTPATGRLRLLEHVLAAADAVAYAHVHGIIHRDLKPANILVGAFGETVVIDWGLAKDLTGESLAPDPTMMQSGPESGSTLTDVGTIVGTLRYMPPEQARGEAVDRRSDVFALGAVLFHLLAGTAPHAGLARPELAARLVSGEAVDLGPLARGVPPPLVAIVQRAMAPRPADRYASAEAFSEDLRRFLAGRLVDAHRYPLAELLRVWLRPRRAVVTVAAAALLALLGASIVFLYNIRAERDLAAAAQVRAESAEVEALRRADSAVLAQARGALAEDVVDALTLLGQVELSDEPRLRSARLTALAAQARGAPERVLRGHSRRIERLAALSDGRLVSVDIGGEVRRWDPRAGHGEVVVDLAAPHGRVVAAAEAPVWVALAADRGHIIRGDDPPEAIRLGALYLGNYDTHLWELSRHGETLAALGERHALGRKFAAAYTWDLLARPALMRTIPFDQTGPAALSPDGAMVVTSDEAQNTVIVEGEKVTALPEISRATAFSPSGRFLLGRTVTRPRVRMALSLADRSSVVLNGGVLAMTADDHALMMEDDPTVVPLVKRQRLVLRSLATGELRWASDLEITREVVAATWGEKGGFAVAPGGERFALQLGGQWQIWSMATGKLEYTLDTGDHPWGTFLADGGFAVAHHADVWVWSPRPPAVPRHYALALASDGSHMVAGTWEAQAPRMMRLADGQARPVSCLKEMLLHQLQDAGPRISVDRRGRVLFVDEEDGVCLEDIDGAAHVVEVSATPTAGALAEVGDGFVVGTADGGVSAWSAVGEAPRRWQLDAGVLRVWPIGAGSSVIAHTGSGTVVAFGPGDDAPVVLGASRPDARLYGVRVVVHPGQATAAVLLADEDAIVFHDPRGASVRRPTSFSVEPAAAYSPSGDRFAVGIAGRTLLVLTSPDEPGHELALPEEARGLAFIDEETLVVGGESGALMRADLRAGDAVVLHRAWEHVGAPTQVTAGAGGDALIVSGMAVLVQPSDAVPWDSQGLRAWLAPRVGAGP